MTLQTQPATEKASEVNLWAAHGHSPEREGDALQAIKTILVDTVLDVGALIDAVLCRCGDWVDWHHYRPLPGIRADNPATDFIVRLALPEDIFGLRFGGYIEMRVARQARTVEVRGGYYDAYDQPEPVIDGLLGCDQVNHQNVGQVLMLTHDRIIRAHIARDVRWQPGPPSGVLDCTHSSGG